jgi:hypothetical protein
MPASPGSPYAARREAAVNLTDYPFVEVKDSNYLEKFKQYWGDQPSGATAHMVTSDGISKRMSLHELFSHLLQGDSENCSGEQNDGTSSETSTDSE